MKSITQRPLNKKIESWIDPIIVTAHNQIILKEHKLYMDNICEYVRDFKIVCSYFQIVNASKGYITQV